MINLDTFLGYSEPLKCEFDYEKNLVSLEYRMLKNTNIRREDYMYMCYDNHSLYNCYTEYCMKACLLTKLLLNLITYTFKKSYRILLDNSIGFIYSLTLKEVNSFIDYLIKTDKVFNIKLYNSINKRVTGRDLKEMLNSSLDNPIFFNNILTSLPDKNNLLYEFGISDIFRIAKNGQILLINTKDEVSSEIFKIGIAEYILYRFSNNKRFFSNKFKVTLSLDDTLLAHYSFNRTLSDDIVKKFVGNYNYFLLKSQEELKDNKRKMLEEVLDHVDHILYLKGYEIYRKRITKKIKIKLNKYNKTISFFVKRWR